MKLFWLMGDTSNACTYYRTVLPARYLVEDLRAEGIEVTVSQNLKSWEIEQYQAFLFYRIPSENFLPQLGQLKRLGKRLLMDYDDDLLTVPQWSSVDITDYDRALVHIGMDFASGFVASTPALAKRLREYRSGTPVQVCPNLVDMTAWPEQDRSQPNDPVRIVWAGSPTHKKDLEEIIEPVTQILRDYAGKVVFIFLGYCHPEILRRHANAGVLYLPSVDLHNYPNTLINLRPDIGLCPLAAHPFNECKSAIKWMELSLAGAEVITSGFGPYRSIPAHKAINADGWIGRSRELLDTGAKCQTATRLDIEQRYSWQGEARKEWVEGLKALLI